MFQVPRWKLTFPRSSMSQIPERSGRGDRCSGWGRFWGVIGGSRCFKNINFTPPQQLQSRNKLTFPFRSRINTADADMLVGKYPGEKARAVSKCRLEYGSVKGRTLGSHHLASSSPPLAPLNSSLPSRMQRKVSQKETNYFRWVTPSIWRATTSVVNAKMIVLQSQYFFCYFLTKESIVWIISKIVCCGYRQIIPMLP